MAEIVKKQLKAKIDGVLTNIYPYTHLETVVDDDGTTLPEILGGMVYVETDNTDNSDIIIDEDGFHIHANKYILDRLDVSDEGLLLYNGQQIAASKATIETLTLYSANWTNDTAPYIYDLGIEDKYSFEMLLPNTITLDEFEIIQAAQIAGCGNDNLLRAWGEKPTIDFSVIIRKWVD